MLLADITTDQIPWHLLFLYMEDLQNLPIHKARKGALQRAATARPESKIAQIIDAWFPADQERLVVPMAGEGHQKDPERQDKIDRLRTQIGAGFETYGFIVTPKYMEQNQVYDEVNNRPVKFQQAIELIQGGREPREGHANIGYQPTNDPAKAVHFLSVRVKDYLEETSYLNSDKVGKGERSVIISRNTTDIATMSTGRPWTSCMDLKDGVNAHHVARAMKDGMIVAYLISGSAEQAQAIASDTNQPINALARIAIKPMRRYMSKVDVTNNAPAGFGWPEDKVYHANRADISGFKETVTQWVREKVLALHQGKMDGKYKVKGGWTDSLDNFDTAEQFHDEAGTNAKLEAALQRHWLHWSDVRAPVTAIYNQPSDQVSEQTRDLAFKVLVKLQPGEKDRVANSATTDKSLRTHMWDQEAMMVKMLRKYPQYLDKVKATLSPPVREWIVGHTNKSLYDYINKLAGIITNALDPKPTDFMKHLGGVVQNAFNHPQLAGMAPNMDEMYKQHLKVDTQTAMRTMSKLKVVLRTFIKEQDIFLPAGTLNNVLNVVDMAEAAGLNVTGVKELLPGYQAPAPVAPPAAAAQAPTPVPAPEQSPPGTS